jgi:hypothetical protein
LQTNGNITTSGSLSLISNVSSQFVNNGDYTYTYELYAESDSNVQWDDINWQPTITQNGITYYPNVNYKNYDNNVNETNYKFTTNFNTTPSISIDPNILNDNLTEILEIKHDMFQPSDRYKYFLVGFEEEEFPLEIDWVVKARDINGTKRLHKAKFFLHRGQFHNVTLGTDYYDYTFRTPQGQVINPSIISFRDYFAYDLTKEEILEIIDNSGELFSQFFIENERFGDNNSAEISIQLSVDQQSNYAFTTNTLQKPFWSKSASFLGNTYRSWGQFLYNGGVKYDYDEEGNIVNPNNTPIETLIPHHNFEDNIDLSIFDFHANPNSIEVETEPDPNFVIRSIRYNQDNENQYFKNESVYGAEVITGDRIEASYQFLNGKLISTLGRFAESNLHDLHLSETELGLDGSSGSTDGFVGLKQRSFSKGKSENGQISAFIGGVSGTTSDSYSEVLNQYIDINGDRYPDIITKGNIQVTSMKGGLSNLNISNDFISGAENEDETKGVSISGMLPNSTSSDNSSTNSPTRTNVNSGINESKGSTFNSRQWIDINGDGLTDKITFTATEVKVNLNIGYDFANEVIWSNGLPLSGLKISTRENSSISGGFSNSSFAVGLGISSSESSINAALTDVNADGLPDLLIKDIQTSNYYFHLNNGKSFEHTASQVFYNNIVDLNKSTTGNIYGSATFGFVFTIPVIPPIPIKVTATPSASVNGGINEKIVTIQDIDGDGLPDVLQQGTDNGDVVARLNKIGKTNLLKAVNTPLGGYWEVTYEREGNTYNLPQNKWVLSQVLAYDGFTEDNDFGTDIIMTTFSYENPKHDRREREFLGFEKVRTNQLDAINGLNLYRYTISEYHNENVYLKGMVKRNATYDANDVLLNESTTLYNIMDPDSPAVSLFLTGAENYLQSSLNESLFDHSRLFVAPVKSVSTSFENQVGLSIEQQYLEYDSFGNLVLYKNSGDTHTPESFNDAYITELEYHNSISGVSHSKGFVKKIQVKSDYDASLLRQREAEYNNDGKLNKVKTKLNDTETNEVNIDYNAFGNIIKSTLQNGFEINISYDNEVYTYPTEISNSFNEVSTASYDYLFGIPVGV